MKIEYTFCDDSNTQSFGAINTTPEAALHAAMDYLDATETKRGYVYLAEETNEAYRVTKPEMLMAGAAILAGCHDWYSIWCASTGTRMSDRTKSKYYGPEMA